MREVSGLKAMLIAVAAVVLTCVVVATLWVGSGDSARVAPGALDADGPKPTIVQGIALTRSGSTLYPENSGAFSLGGLRFCVVHFDPKWQMTEQGQGLSPEAGSPRRRGDGAWELRGQWQTASGAFAYAETVKRIDPQTLAYEATAESETGVQTNSLAMSITLPIAWYASQDVIVDGRRVQLVAESRPANDSVFFPAQTARSVEIATPDGYTTVDGPAMVSIQDVRPYGAPSYVLRLDFSPAQGLIKESHLRLTVRHVNGTPAQATTAPATKPQ
jgi:hypothetical protein